MLGNKDVMARNIKRLLEVNDMSVADLSRALDVPYTTASEWVHAKAYPRIDKIERMARLFRVMKSDLVEEEANHKKKARRVPVYGRIAAGLPLEAVQDVDDWEEVPAEWSGDYLALRVQGDSMTPRICSGDVVIIRRQPTAENGQLAACYVNGYDATLKRIQHAGDQIILMANNPAFPPQIYPAKDVTILGVVVELRAKF